MRLADACDGGGACDVPASLQRDPPWPTWAWVSAAGLMRQLHGHSLPERYRQYARTSVKVCRHSDAPPERGVNLIGKLESSSDAAGILLLCPDLSPRMRVRARALWVEVTCLPIPYIFTSYRAKNKPGQIVAKSENTQFNPLCDKPLRDLTSA